MSTSATYVCVAVPRPLFQTYTYEVPEALAAAATVGRRALVPFGPRQQKIAGYILGPGDPSGLESVKPIAALLDDAPLFPPSLLPFLRWTADYYMHPLGQVIQGALPGGLNPTENDHLTLTPAGGERLDGPALPSRQEKILRALHTGSITLKALRRRLGSTLPLEVIRALEANGWVARQRQMAGGKTRPRRERFVQLQPGGEAQRLSPARRRIAARLSSGSPLAVSALKAEIPNAPNLLRAMARDGQVRIFDKDAYRDPFGEPIEPQAPHLLTAEQGVVVERVAERLGQGFEAFLLAGVTGSGKTEVYLQLAQMTVDQGNNALVLVPEIALITQMERRFRARFGDRVAVLHSGLSPGERYDQWLRILRGEVSVAIGARSAVFAPFASVGIVVVDEEHDPSYKQDGGLHYNARDLAVVRARQDQAVALLGSATPSIQSYHNVRTRKFKALRLTRRVEERRLPQIDIVDLRASRDERGLRRFISAPLSQALAETLERGDQALLFLNRRGFAGYPVCAACGQALTCKNCDITLTYHRAANAYRCHYCGFSRAAVDTCPACASDRIRNLGMGTEKVEDAVKALFPAARVARMDRDTTTRKGALVRLLKGLRQRTIDVLVGTQMVAKGHDFPHITLVGIICADLSLSFPDFRAGERTFQLLAQVAGRAGRGATAGRVILQTYAPEHFSIAAARQQDFEAFYEHEIGFRRDLGYPPFSRMIQLKLSGRDRERTERAARFIGDRCQDLLNREPRYRKTVVVLGPIEAPLQRIAGHFRWQVLIKGHPVGALHRFVRTLLSAHGSAPELQATSLVVDVDPFFML